MPEFCLFSGSQWTTGSRHFGDFTLVSAPIRPTQKALHPSRVQCFCFICLEKLGLDIAHLEGADDAAVLALGDT